MTSFRRLVVGVAQFCLIINIVVVTLISGLVGAVEGSAFSSISNTTVQFANSVPVSIGVVIGFCLGSVDWLHSDVFTSCDGFRHCSNRAQHTKFVGKRIA